MAEFILTSSGFINLDHVLLIRVGVEKEEGEDLIQMSDGRIVQCVIHDRSFLPKPPQPAAVGSGEPDYSKPKYDDGGGEKTEV